eukprot:13094917-Alexandrium_andersonii.AAC.1
MPLQRIKDSAQSFTIYWGDIAALLPSVAELLTSDAELQLSTAEWLLRRGQLGHVQGDMPRVSTSGPMPRTSAGHAAGEVHALPRRGLAGLRGLREGQFQLPT